MSEKPKTTAVEISDMIGMNETGETAEWRRLALSLIDQIDAETANFSGIQSVSKVRKLIGDWRISCSKIGPTKTD